ncbi:MAG: ABC transporter permease subunit [Clostridia bacterium]|nr:ABC transporter permease subunit [Clostridia bacterium]MBR5751999.1 ABC transporter permease subunit [Clostridia bacterium]
MRTSISSRNDAATRRPRPKLWAALVWLLVWQAVSMLMDADAQQILLASPLQVIGRLFELIRTSDFWRRVLFSSFTIMSGLLAGALAGVLLGAAAFFSNFIRELLRPLLAVIRSIPVVSFIILVLYWLSDRSLSVFIAFLICFPVFYTHTLTGFGAADPKMLEMAKVFGLSFGGRLKAVYLPALLPHLSAAMEVASGLAWKSGTAAEYIAIPAGSIGRKLYEAKSRLNSADTLSWTLAIVMLNSLFSFLLKTAMRKAARKWGDAE